LTTGQTAQVVRRLLLVRKVRGWNLETINNTLPTTRYRYNLEVWGLAHAARWHCSLVTSESILNVYNEDLFFENIWQHIDVDLAHWPVYRLQSRFSYSGKRITGQLLFLVIIVISNYSIVDPVLNNKASGSQLGYHLHLYGCHDLLNMNIFSSKIVKCPKPG